MRELARTVRFTPYRKGMGPTFTLRMFWTGLTGEYGKLRIGYTLTMREPESRKPVVLFDGDDYFAHCEPDQNEAVGGIMGFLTLRPGDTDTEYFDAYTDAQRAYCDAHAEQLSGEVSCRFQCHECGGSLDDNYSCRSHGKAKRAS